MKNFDFLYTAVSKKISEKVADMRERLVNETPVDTGYSSSSYFMSFGIAPFLAVSVDSPTVSRAADAKTRSNASVSKTKENYDIRKGNIFITNTVPYLELINATGTKSVSSGFLDRAVKGGK